MSTIDATVSVMESMPEASRKKVLIYAQNLVLEDDPENPFLPLTKEQILHDLAISEKDYQEGRVQNFRDAIIEMRKQHGFV